VIDPSGDSAEAMGGDGGEQCSGWVDLGVFELLGDGEPEVFAEPLSCGSPGLELEDENFVAEGVFIGGEPNRAIPREGFGSALGASFAIGLVGADA